MKYFKLFKLHSEYETYINSEDKLLPNLSYCEDVNDVHFNPWVAPSRVLTAVYNIPTTANPISLYLDEFPNEIESVLVTRPNGTTFELSSSDLVEYDSIYEEGDPFLGYQFDMTGEHTFEYTFKPNVTTFEYQLFFQIQYVTSVNIPNCITSIFGIDAVYSAFGGCTGLTSLTIPNSVIEIGEDAFSSCSGLTSINIPNSVTTIGEGAFRQCSGLTSVTIPNSVTSIGSRAFYYCQNLESITFEDVTKITINDENGDFIFADCPKLESINITADTPWTFMPYRGFMRCYALKSIVIPNTVTNIMGMALCNCTSLTSITIPAGVTTIGMQAFDGCTSLTSITCLPTTPPTLKNTNQFNATNNCPIYVPAESVAAYKAASGWSSYASRIQAIS
jgi:hypothetical protein